MENVKFVDTVVNTLITDLINKQDQRTLALWAAECAGHILSLFEDEYPYDARPLQAIEAGRGWAWGEISLSEAREKAFAAHAAARDVKNEAACAAARSAGHAAATAHVADHATHAATYAVKAVAYAAEIDPELVRENTAKERIWQWQRLMDLAKTGFINRIL